MSVSSNAQEPEGHCRQMQYCPLHDRKIKILLVEDNEIVKLSLKLILEDQLNCEVEIAESGEMALKIFPEGFDVIVMDIGLPGISGIQTIQIIRERYPHLAIPIIIHTAHGSSNMIEKCRLAGISAFLQKGASHRLLCQKIQEHVIQNRPNYAYMKA